MNKSGDDLTFFDYSDVYCFYDYRPQRSRFFDNLFSVVEFRKISEGKVLYIIIRTFKLRGSDFTNRLHSQKKLEVNGPQTKTRLQVNL